MKVVTRNSPSAGVARCYLDAGETLSLESGAMYAMSGNIDITSSMQGGIVKSILRNALSGDSFFVSRATAIREPGWIDIVASYDGDVFDIIVEPDNPLILARGVWLGSEQSVSVDAKFSSPGMMIGREGLTMVKCSGHGAVIGASHGAVDVFHLEPGEKLVLDNGHLLAYEARIQATIRKAGTGIINSFTSGEGLVYEFTGPGAVIAQSRPTPPPPPQNNR